jgi:hypothetical protein
MIRRWLFPASLLTLAFLGALVLIARGDWIAARVNSEVFKVLAQLVLLTALGGVGSLAIEEFRRALERREQTKERLRNALSGLITSYNEIKGLRRRLRAEAIRPNSEDPAAVVNGDEYATLLQRLNDAQLTIEAYVRLIEGNTDLYPDSPVLIDELGTAEKYLGKLITEWEKNLGTFQGTPSQQSLAKLPLLRCFVGDASMGFKPSFSDPISKVLVILSRAIAR